MVLAEPEIVTGITTASLLVEVGAAVAVDAVGEADTETEGEDVATLLIDLPRYGKLLLLFSCSVCTSKI